MPCNSCEVDCCYQNAQLCVDAQIYVPLNGQLEAFATGLNFGAVTGANPSIPLVSTVSPSDNILTPFVKENLILTDVDRQCVSTLKFDLQFYLQNSGGSPLLPQTFSSLYLNCVTKSGPTNSILFYVDWNYCNLIADWDEHVISLTSGYDSSANGVNINNNQYMFWNSSINVWMMNPATSSTQDSHVTHINFNNTLRFTMSKTARDAIDVSYLGMKVFDLTLPQFSNNSDIVNPPLTGSQLTPFAWNLTNTITMGTLNSANASSANGVYYWLYNSSAGLQTINGPMIVGNQVLYTNNGENIPTAYIQAVSAMVAQNTQTNNILAADLSLQLRSNKNVLQLNEGNTFEDGEEGVVRPAFPNGKYDICVSFKPCDDEDNCEGQSLWENAVVLRLIKEDCGMRAVWGADTDKRGKPVAKDGDSAVLRGLSSVCVCGNIQDVYLNKNDMAIHIDNIFQAFSVSGVIITQDGKFVDTPCQQAKLDNTKLYVSLKYVAQYRVEQQAGGKKVYDMCPGTLNPFVNAVVNNGFEVRQTKGFLMKELTHLNDQPFQLRGSDRQVSVILTNEDIEEADDAWRAQRDERDE